MSTRVSRFADRFVEAGWLAAVIVTPLFFNVWSNRVFEPDKLTLLRSIALMMVAASAVRWVEVGLPSRSEVVRWLRIPLVVPVLLITASYLLSTVTSVVPYQSLTGGYQRLQGLYSWLGYVVVFMAIVALVRDRSRLDRLVFALILPSLPVGLYGIVQKFGREIMPWQGDTTKRIASTMGNSIFVAAFLIVVVPLTMARLAEAMRDLDEDEGNAAVLRVSGYLVLLAIQVLAVIFSQSRGPLLGLLGGVFFLFLLMAALKASRRGMAAVVGAGVAVAAFLVVFNLPASPLAPLRSVPYVGRLGRVFETQAGTGRVRVLIWEGAVELIESDPTRLIIGWGPESMQVAYTPFYQPELGTLESRNASPDRSHNEVFDVLVNLGLVGLAAHLLLFTSLFYYGLKWLGFVDGPTWRNLFLGLWAGGGALSAAAFWRWAGNATFFGVALPAGMVAGLFAFVALRAMRGWSPPDRPGRLLMAGLMGGLIAHFIEIHFGIAIAATRVAFFALAGALVAVGHFGGAEADVLAHPPAGDRPTPSARSRGRRRRRPPPSRAGPVSGVWTSHGLLVLAILATLVFDFIVWTKPDALKLVILLWLFTMTWGFASLVLGTETLLLPGGDRRGLGRYLALTIGGALVYALVHWTGLVMGQGAGADTSDTLLGMYYGVMLGLLAAWAAVLALGDKAQVDVARGRLALAYPLVFVAAAGAAWVTNVNEVRADIHYKQAWVFYHGNATSLTAQGNVADALRWYDLAVGEYDRASALDGREDYYQLFRGKALLESADAQAGQTEADLRSRGLAIGDSEYDLGQGDPELGARVAARDEAFRRAIQQLEKARRDAPLNVDHTANLGRAYQVWGDRTLDADRRAERFATSRSFFEAAIALNPHNPGLRDELAMTLKLMGDTEGARERLAESIAIDPTFGRPHRLLAVMAREEKDWDAAAQEYQAYVASADGKKDSAAWSGLAYVLGQQDKVDEAIAANEKVLEILDRDDIDTLRNLALLANRADDLDAACSYIARGLLTREDPGLRGLAGSLPCTGRGMPIPPPPVPGNGGAGAPSAP